ncbi:MAG: tetratricopeptide repeat protein [Planctomycetales bacterium]
MSFARRLRSALWGAVCLALAATGCAKNSGTLFPGDAFGRRQPSPRHREQAEYSRKVLTNPGRTHLAYARLQEGYGNLEEARGSYDIALREDPRSTDAMLGLARIDQLSGRTAEAEQGYLKLLRNRPKDPAVLDAVVEFYAAQEKWDDAIRYLHEATLAAPHEPAYRHRLAVAYARSGNIEAARPHFARTAGDAEAHYNIGHILFEQGDLDGAEREFRQAVVMKPQLRQAQQMLDEVVREREERLMFAGHSGLPR